VKNPHQGPTLRFRRLAFETLEPRALLSADLLPVAELPEPAPPLPAEFREEAAPSAALPAVALGAEMPRELVIIDAGVQGADALARDWAGRGFEVVLLDPARDALDQIGALLGDRRGLDAVHLVSHGTAGGLQLGGALLNATDLSARAAEVARWADAFAADGDLLLYGCDVADGETGRAFAERLALLTGADVAASADATGAALLGGDWSLEHATGAIESASLPPVDAWLGLLVVDTLDWDAVLLAGEWPDSSFGSNNLTTALGGTIVGTVTGDTGFLVDVGGGDPRITPVVVDRVDAGTGENTLQLQMDGLAPGQGVTLTLDFSAYAFGVSNISLTVFDVDSGGFIDRITVTSDRGDPTTLVASSVNTTSGTDTIVGSGAGNSPNNSPNGNATFTYTWSLADDNSGIRTLTIRYGNDGGPVGQGIGIHDVTFDPTPGASNRTVNTTENVAYTFSTADFGFQDVGGDALESVRITQLPTAGTLRLNGVAVTLGQSIAAADIAANLLTFHPAPNASGAGYSDFRFRVGDGTSLSQSDYAMTVNVAAVNDAPTLAGGPFALAGTNEDTASAGTLVSALLAGLTHGDVDAGALSGISVTASTGNGTWQYSTDGVTWNGVGGVSINSALLLSDTTRVRYVPDGANGETAQLTFRAWDRTSGLASTNATRQTADTTANGGTTAFSTGTAQATITVADVNDAPVLNAARTPVLASVSEDATAPVGAVGTLVSSLVDDAVPAGQVDNVTDADTGALLGIALIGTDTTQGTWHYSLDNGASWTALPAVGPANALLLAADAGTRLYFQPNPDYAGTLASAVTFRAWDRTSGTAGALANPGAGGGSSAFSTASDTASLTVTGANDAPVIGSLAADARGYAAGSGAVVVDQGAAATVIDVDSANFDGGELRIAIASGEVAAEDVLAIATGPSVSLSAGMTVGSVVTVSGAAIGTITSTGAGGADLVIALDADATPARVTTLVGAITYANADATSPTPGPRTIRFTLTDGDGGTSANVDATVTVKPVASIAATDAAAAEPGNDGRYTVTLSGASATDTTVAYVVTGTATGGTDYVALTGQVTILAGMTTAFIDVDVLDDLRVEAAETVIVTLDAITAGDSDIRVDTTAAGATVTLADNDTAALTVADVTVNEGAGTISFSVGLDLAVQGGFSVDALFGGGTATGSGTDYASASQTLAFAGNAGEIQVVTLAVNNDLIVEASETFTLSLGNLAPATAPGTAITITDTATGTILDNDTAALTVADVMVNEAAGTISFSVVLDRAVQGGFSVDALFSGGTATGGVDYDATTRTLAFAGTAGEVQVVTLPLFDDPVVEADEIFTISLANVATGGAPAGAISVADTATGTIANDDSAPTIADTSVVLPENSAATTLVLDLQDALTGTDADPDGDAITYAIIGGNAAGAFTIDAATGTLTVANPGPLDFETTPVFVLTVQATDGTNTDTATITIDLANVNEAPTVTAPAAGIVAEDAAAGFSVAGGNAITVADVDAATLRLTLTATNGVLSLGSLAGLAFTTGDGTADATMTFSGSIADLNAALDGLAFAPAADYHGAAVVSLLAEDLGQSGSGGPRSAAAAVGMTVTPVNDAPTIGGDLALLVLEGQAVTVLSADLLGVDVDDNGAGLVFDVVAAPGRGRMEFADAPGVAISSFTQADLDAGRVRYLHDGSETTADQFTLRLSDGGEDGAAPDIGTLGVVVVPVNDAPALATGGGDVDEGARIVLTAALVSAFDPDNGADALLFTLDTVIGGYVELASAAGVPITSFTGAQLDAGLVRFVQADGAAAPAFRVKVSDGEASDGPRVVVLTLRAAGGLTQDAPAREAASGLLTAVAFRDDARLAEVRSPQLMAFLREPKLAPAGPTLAEPEPVLPAAPVTRVAGAALQTPPIELAAAGLRFVPPPPGEVAVPRIDFSFEPGRHNLEPPEGGASLGIAAVDAVRVAGLALTAGGVWWVFRMGSLIGSALVSAPAWRHIDPLPVLGGGSRENVEWDAADEPPTDEASDASERYFDRDDTANSQRR
jgi:hypothetical protein